MMAEPWNPDLSGARIPYGSVKLVQWLHGLSDEDLVLRTGKVWFLTGIYGRERDRLTREAEQLGSRIHALVATGGDPPPEQVGKLVIARQRLLDRASGLSDEISRCETDIDQYCQEWRCRVARGDLAPVATNFD